MPSELANELPVCDIPFVDRSVLTCPNQALSVTTELDDVNLILVTGDCLHNSVAPVADQNRLVVTDGGEPVALRTEGKIVDHVSMLSELGDGLLSLEMLQALPFPASPSLRTSGEQLLHLPELSCRAGPLG